MPTKPLADMPSAEELHEAIIAALKDARDAIPAARAAGRGRVEITAAVEHRIECVKRARSYGMPFDEIADVLGVSVSYVQKMTYSGATK
jgi:hypothetical protein